MAAKDPKLHIALFPWLAFGHMTPYLGLAKLIAKKGHQISFLSTPRNIERLPKLPPNLSSLIHFVELPLPHVDDLPENADATYDVPYQNVTYLKKAYDGLQPYVTKFLETHRPDWILYDFVAHWLPPIANNLAISNMFFSIFIAAFVTIIKPTSPLMDIHDDRTKPEHFTAPPKWITFQSTVAFRHFEISRIFDSITGIESEAPDIVRMENVIRECDALAVRSCKELEGEYLHLLEKIHGKPVLPVGQLPTTGFDTMDEENETWKTIKEWLDNQEKNSVLYVAFGSEAKPSQEELTEIALGLELSQFPFFWVVRTQRGTDDTERTELPEGFEERTTGRGVVYTSWAPQIKILAHDSVGGFLTHAGWSSVVEAIQFEKPLIFLTFLADQGINARILEEKKLAYSIPRNHQDGSFTRNAVAESLKLVLKDEEGKIYRDNVKEMRDSFVDSDKQEHYVDNFLGYLKTHRRSSFKKS